jgi:hypothetical protein
VWTLFCLSVITIVNKLAQVYHPVKLYHFWPLNLCNYIQINACFVVLKLRGLIDTGKGSVSADGKKVTEKLCDRWNAVVLTFC